MITTKFKDMPSIIETLSLSPQQKEELFKYYQLLLESKDKFIYLPPSPLLSNPITIEFELHDFIKHPGLSIRQLDSYEWLKHQLVLSDEDYKYISENPQIIVRFINKLNAEDAKKIIVSSNNTTKIIKEMLNIFTNTYRPHVLSEVFKDPQLLDIIKKNPDTIMELTVYSLFVFDEQVELALAYLSSQEARKNEHRTTSILKGVLCIIEENKISLPDLSVNDIKNIIKNVKYCIDNRQRTTKSSADTKIDLYRKLTKLISRLCPNEYLAPDNKESEELRKLIIKTINPIISKSGIRLTINIIEKIPNYIQYLPKDKYPHLPMKVVVPNVHLIPQDTRYITKIKIFLDTKIGELHQCSTLNNPSYTLDFNNIMSILENFDESRLENIDVIESFIEIVKKRDIGNISIETLKIIAKELQKYTPHKTEVI